MEIQFEEMAELGTLEDCLAECGYEKRTDIFVPLYKKIVSEQYSLRIA
ncbi:hypothetical protein [Desulfonema magnum]|uniref:Uncharacterized protein n=1 Tax=Desulfonema magnum TaxID=45655 RepID=A0A975BKX5_9BACT|nr:hypothetical protein [Desulfonema magnum]QTA87018.1 Uncharacterized protein dnm_030450 [Desulfonema magnum]